MNFKRILFFIYGTLMVFAGLLVFGVTPEKNVAFVNSALSYIDDSDESIGFVILGKPGGDFIAPELFDSIAVLKLVFSDAPRAYAISIPRDLYVKNADDGAYTKINGIRPPLLAAQTISSILGAEFPYYIVFDLAVIKKIVDALGGIEIEVATEISDPGFSFSIPAGRQTLHSREIELLVRSRAFPDGDFTRISHQQQVALALFEKIRKLNPLLNAATIYELYRLGSAAETNLGIIEAFTLYNKIKNLNIANVDLTALDIAKSGLLKASTADINGTSAFVLVPSAGLENYGEIRAFVKKFLEATN